MPVRLILDYESGEELKGLQYWKPFVDIFWDYVNHPEAKFDGDVGVLSRKHVIVGSAVHIGKESNNLEQAGVLGAQENDYVRYDSSQFEQLMERKEKILLADSKDIKKYGVSRQTLLYNVKEAIACGAWNRISSCTINRLLAFVSACH